MVTLPSSHPTDAQPESADSLEDRRRAPWLLSPYSAPVWIVSDTRDPARTRHIDFRLRLADGTLLIDSERLYATVKEYAFWVRDSRFSRIDDAETHGTLVRNLMALAHALTRRNIWTFAHIQPFHVEQIVEECRFGMDGLLHASERVEAYLQSLALENVEQPRKFGGLPGYIIPSSGARTTLVNIGAILEACNLPASASRLPRVKALIDRAAEEHGLRRQRIADTPELKPLVNVTTQSMQRWLDPLEQLYVMRRHIEGDTLTYKPFPRGAGRVAAVKGVGTSRTPIPPPHLVLYLLEKAFEWIVAHGAPSNCAGMSRQEALSLATACWIVIAAFTARRDEEIDELNADCLSGDDEKGWWLHVYIEKTLQRKEWIPVPNIVARAVEALRALSAAARANSGTADLFQWQDSEGNVIAFDVGSQLDDFAQAVEVPLHQAKGEAPAPWHWHPHQFRRFFAVLYFYRFEGATLEALSHHLRHFSLEMTRRYVTQDPEVAALWTDVEWGYMGHVARSIASGGRVVSGSAGERLKRLAQRLVDVFRRKLQIASPERVGASMSVIMQREGLVLTPKPWVTCTCPRTIDAAKRAGCRSQTTAPADAVGPDFAHAGPTVCAACPHAIIDSDKQPYVEAEISNLEAAASSTPRVATLFGELQALRVVELRTFRDAKYAGASSLARPATDPEEVQ